MRFRVSVEVGIDAELARAAARRAGQEMARELTRALGSIDMSAASRRMAAAFSSLEPILRRLAEISRTIGAGPGLDALIRRIDDLEERLRRLEGAGGGGGGGRGGGLIAMFAGIAAAIGGAGLAMKLFNDSINAALALDSMRRGFEAISGGAQGAARELEFVRGVATRLGLDLRQTSQDWMKLAAAANGTALEGKGARDIFTAVSEAARVLGLDAQRTSLSLNAIQQMISKGTVSAEELRGQLGENLPGAFQVAARSMGVTTAELGKMLETGKVTAEELLPRMARELHNLYGVAASAAGQGPAAQFARMRSAIFDAEGALGKALLPALGDLAQSITNLVSSNGFGVFARTVGAAVGLIVSALALVTSNLDSMLILFAGFAAANIPAIAAAVAAGFNLVRTSVIGVNLAMAANPAVIAWLAVAAAVAGVNLAIKAMGATHAAETAQMVASSERVRDSWAKTQEAIESANASMIASQAYLVESKLAVAESRLAELKAEADRVLADARANPDAYNPDTVRNKYDPDVKRRAEQLKEVTQALSDQKGAVMALQGELSALTKTQADAANGEGAYGSQVTATIKSLNDKLAGLVATREKLGLVGQPLASVKVAAEAAGNAMERISKLNIDPGGTKGLEIQNLELSIAIMTEQIRKAESTTLPDKIDKLADSASLAEVQLRAVGDAYAISTAAGLAAQRQMEAEIAVRGRLRGATEEQIQAQIKAALAQGEEQRRADTQKTLAQMKEEAELRDQVTAAYARGVEIGDQVAQQIEQQININNQAATSAKDLEQAVRNAYAALARQQQAIKAANIKATLEAEEKQLRKLINAYKDGGAAVGRLTLEQARMAEKIRLTKGLTQEQKKAIDGLIDSVLELRDANAALAELQNGQRELDLLKAKLAVRRQDYATLEGYHRALREITFQMELQKQFQEDIKNGWSAAQAVLHQLQLKNAEALSRTLESRDVETAWQAGVKAMTETLQSGLVDAGVSAINQWVEFGDSWVENLLESLIEAFASAALQAAISAAFSNNGQGFWANLAGSLGGAGGGGGAAGGGGGWGQYLSGLVSAYKAWQSGASVWGALSGTTTTAGGGISATAATTQVSNGYTITTGSGGGGGLAGSAGGTALAVAGWAALIIAAFNLIKDERDEKLYRGVGQTFGFGFAEDPNAPRGPGLPPVPGSSRGGDGPTISFAGSNSTTGPDGLGGIFNTPTITSNGDLGRRVAEGEVEKLRQLVHDSTIGLVETYGGYIKKMGAFTINMRNDGDEFAVTVNGVETKFKELSEALNFGIESMLSGAEITGLSANVAAVFANASKIGLESLDAALAMAQAADDALAGTVGRVIPATTLFSQQLKELEAQIAKDTAQGLAWGISLEALNALGDKRIEQLEREQAAFAGQQVSTVLEQLFALSPQAAADAELAMIYQRAVGAMRIAQLQMEADKLAMLGYLTAAQMNLIQGYIDALDEVGAGGAVISGGGGGGGQDPGVAQREARRAELWQMLRDLEAGGAAAVGSLAAALQKAKGLGDEMRALNMGDIYADKMTKLATLAAGADFMKPFEAIISGAGISDAASKWDALKAKYAEAQASLLAGAEELAAAGFDVEAAMAQLREANRIEAEKLGQDLLGTFGDPFLKLKADAADLADRLRLLDEMVAAGAISVADAAEVHRWVAQQAFTGMVDSLLGIMDRYYSNVKIADDARAALEQAKFTLEIAQLQLQFELIKAMGLLTDEQITQIDGLFEYIRLNPPDFTKKPPVPPPGPDPGSIGSGIDQAAQDLERLMQLLRGWEDLALTPAERRLRDINEQFAIMLELAGRDQAMIARVRAAYGIALKDFYTGLRAPLKDLLQSLGIGPASTKTTRNQVLDLQAQYEALVARLAANPNDAAAIEQLNTVARALLQAAGNYGQDGALYAGISANLQAMLPRILAGLPFDPRLLGSGAAANDNSTDRRGRFTSPGPTRDPVLEQAKSDRREQHEENVQILAELRKIRIALDKNPAADDGLRTAVNALTAAAKRKLA